MTVTTTPHLNFRGDARAALEFYHRVFGGQLFVMTNEETHSAETPEEAQQVKFGPGHGRQRVPHLRLRRSVEHELRPG